MKIIYEPKGAAREYAELAVNDYVGCPHACKYCFAPSVMRKDRDDYHRCVSPRTEPVMKWFEHDCKLMAERNDERRVHMNFISDPYPELEKEEHLTRYCIETASKYGVGINVLTKGHYDTVSPDLELMKRANVHFGITNCFSDDNTRSEWEPNASSLEERYSLLKQAHEMGIFTWVSMEPVIDPSEALDFFDRFNHIVDLWKVGKLNYHERSKSVDWVKFREDFKKSADHCGAKYIIKKSLQDAS